jgi:hypothetical protein
MKLLSILALATAAIATTNTTNTEADANNMAINEQAEAQAPHAEAGAADVQHWWPKPPFHHKCRPGSYSCTWSRNGWRVCDWSGHWVASLLSSPSWTRCTGGG